MIKYFVLLDISKNPIAFYNDTINKEIPDNVIEISEIEWKSYFECGFKKIIWDGNKWIEGMSQDEIDELNNRPRELTEIEQLKISQAEQFETILEILGGMM